MDFYDRWEAGTNFIWSFPNRTRDLNFYQELPDLGVWDRKWLWQVDDLAVSGFVNDPEIEKKCLKLMKVSQRTWLESERRDQSAALAWHLALRRLSVWPKFSPADLTFAQMYESGWDASGPYVYRSVYDIWELQRMLLNGLVRQFMWVDWMSRVVASGSTVADLVLSEADLRRCWNRLNDCLRLWDGSYQRKDGWRVSLPGWVRDGSVVGFASSWREVQCYSGLGPALVPLFDYFDSVAVDRKMRRSSHLLRSISDNMFAKNLPTILGIMQENGLMNS